MFKGERVLGIILILFIIIGGVYFTVSKLKQDISDVDITASPSPIASSLQAPPTPKSSQLPLEKNKRLSRFPGILTKEDLQNKKAVIETGKGMIELEIYPEASMAASNFIILADNGFYNGLTFHRVEPKFVIQGGDPSGNGTGGPGYEFPDEKVTRDYKKGIVAYANSGPNTNGSQFFIMLEDNLSLPKLYTIFGKVFSGMDVVEKIRVGDVMQKVTIRDMK